jgi:signal transduction histidine kinase
VIAEDLAHSASDRERPTRRRALGDLAVCAAVVIAGGVLFALFDIVERIQTLTKTFEHVELDEALLALVLALVMAVWFAARRWNDTRVSLRALKASEHARRSYVARLEQLSSELLTAEERERHRIADLVHDDLGQALYAARLRLSVLTRLLPEGELRALSVELEELTGEALTRARDLSMQLSPPALDDLGVAEALETLLPTLSRRYPVSIALEPSPAFARIPEQARAPTFHSIKELVMNAIKHASASRIRIAAEEHERAIEVSVTDDGAGFDIASRNEHAGFGLFSIERRMAYLNAELEVQSAPGAGTRAALRIPV